MDAVALIIGIIKLLLGIAEGVEIENKVEEINGDPVIKLRLLNRLRMHFKP